jgi:uncharacterized iron-regulated membrane protein
VLQALTTAGMWFAIVWLPILLVGGLVVGLVAWMVRRVRSTGAGPRPSGEEPVAG